MIKLAVKEKSILVDPDFEESPDFRLRMQTLTDAEAAEILSGRVQATQEGEVEGVVLEMPMGKMLMMFSDKLMGVEGDELQMDGAPFDPTNADHIASLPLNWKITAMTELVNYATSLSRDSVKNSIAQALPSERDTTPSAVG